VHRRPQQERDERLGDPDRAVEEGSLVLRIDEDERAFPAERAVGREAGDHVGRRRPLVAEQVRDGPRRRQLPRHVVVEEAEDLEHARIELRGGADPEHGRLERVEPEQPRRLAEAVVGRRAVRLDRPRVAERVLGRDVEAGHRILGVATGGDQLLDRLAHPRSQRGERRVLRHEPDCIPRAANPQRHGRR
jgi:hypothetical protein